MINQRSAFSKLWFPILMLMALALIVACGSPATEEAETGDGSSAAVPTATAVPQEEGSAAPEEEPTEPPQTGSQQESTPRPTSTPRPAPTTAVQTHKPEGVMNYAVKETGVFEGHPRFMSLSLIHI